MSAPDCSLDREKAAKSDIEALQYTGPTWMNVSMRELIAVLLLQRMGLAIIFLLEVPLLSSSRWTRRSSLDMKLEKPCVDFPSHQVSLHRPCTFQVWLDAITEFPGQPNKIVLVAGPAIGYGEIAKRCLTILLCGS